MNPAENYTYRYLETDDLDQYNALLRYTFQVTEDELTATGWKDDEIKQSKFPVLERADVLGCFDGENLVSQFAVYPLKMNIYDAVYHVGFVTSVCTYPEYTGNGIMKRLMIQGLTQMHKEGKSFALLYPYSIPLYHHLGWEIISNKISYNIKDRQIPTKVSAPGYVRRVAWDNTEFHELHSHFASITHGCLFRNALAWEEYWRWDEDDTNVAVYYNVKDKPCGYMVYLISLGIYSFRGVKVGLDCANGSSWNIAKSEIDELCADTYVINNQPNGLNINLNAGSTHIEGLQKFVVEKGLDVGFAYDGDADRCLCVDEKVNVITGDHILYIYGCYMKERGKLLTNTVVTTVMSNFGLYKAFDEQGIGYAKTAVGDKYVYEYMAKNGCRIGGEQSGHIIFSKYASTGDGILTSLKMMEVMLAKKKPLSALAAPLKIYPQVLENVRVTDKKAAQDDAAVQAAVKAVAEALGDTGRILVRESGTEPVVRVMVEAPDHDTCQKYVSQVVDVIKAQGYSV